MAKYDDLDNKQIFVIGIGSVAVTVVTILAVFYVYYLLLDLNKTTWQANSSYDRQNTILAKQSETLEGYGATKSATVAIPIESAMKLVIQQAAAPAGESSDPVADDMPAEPSAPVPVKPTPVEPVPVNPAPEKPVPAEKPEVETPAPAEAEKPAAVEPETAPVEAEKPAEDTPGATEETPEPKAPAVDPPETAGE